MGAEPNADGFYPGAEEADGAQRKTGAGDQASRKKGRNGVEPQTSQGESVTQNIDMGQNVKNKLGEVNREINMFEGLDKKHDM